jgi:hypothetical protein
VATKPGGLPQACRVSMGASIEVAQDPGKACAKGGDRAEAGAREKDDDPEPNASFGIITNGANIACKLM